MKMLNHPNIVNLIEVIDDPNTDHFYMGMQHLTVNTTTFFYPSNPCIFFKKSLNLYFQFLNISRANGSLRDLDLQVA